MPCAVILGDDVTSGNIFKYIKDVQIDGSSIVDQDGVANIDYSDETMSAANQVFGTITSPELEKFQSAKMMSDSSDSNDRTAEDKTVESPKKKSNKPSRKKKEKTESQTDTTNPEQSGKEDKSV